MNGVYQQIVERIRGEALDLDKAVSKAQRSWFKALKHTEEQDLYLDSVALNLHGFYSGIERLFELIARGLDRITPVGESWHRDLLEQMTRNVFNTRPAVISVLNAERLDEYRRFRHLVRNIYAADLIPERMARMLINLPGLWTDLRAELLAFADFLDQSS